MSEHYKSQGSNRWRTPANLVARVHKLFNGPPDLDPASDIESNKIVQAKHFKGLDDVNPEQGIPTNWDKPEVPKTIFINPPGGRFGNTTLAKLFWRAARDMRDAYGSETLWFAYNINQLQTLQRMSKSVFNHLTDVHICIPDKRLGCIDAATGLLQEDPPSACAFVFLPRRFDRGAEARFHLAFSDLGIILSSSPSISNFWGSNE